MERIAVYINTKASRVATGNWETRLRFHLRSHHLEFRTPQNQQQLSAWIQADKDANIKTIIAVGGDGTVNLILQQIHGSGIRLIVLPSGTANDLAHELGMTANMEEIVALLQSPQEQNVDLIQINGKVMATNGGLGMAANVAAQINHYRALVPGFRLLMAALGRHAYTMGVAKEYLRPHFPLLDLQLTSPDLKGRTQRVQTVQLLINNQPRLAGKYQVAPQTKNYDGTFNVLVFLTKNRFSFLRSIWQAEQGLLDFSSTEILSFETNSLVIENLQSTPLRFFGDGEILDIAHRFQIGISPERIPFLTHATHIMAPELAEESELFETSPT